MDVRGENTRRPGTQAFEWSCPDPIDEHESGPLRNRPAHNCADKRHYVNLELGPRFQLCPNVPQHL
jgi:hypothetical protein